MKKLLVIALTLMLLMSFFGCNFANTAQPQQDAISTTAPITEPVTENITEAVSEQNADTKEGISEQDAKEIALTHAKLEKEEITKMSVELDYDDGIQIYEVEFKKGQVEYDYEIDAKTGKLLSYDKDIND